MKSLLFAASLLLCASYSKQLAAKDNALTQEEKAAGWELLFDGNTLQGWRNYQ